MKHLSTLFIYLLTTLLSAMAWQPIEAQKTKQDALYIFRNDGKFNAFFFDDIDHIDYSHVDTLGVEHHDVVVQEVYALDSVFRIPLSAIDSVSFVTPETVYKKDVIKASPQVANYVIASDSASWIRLSNDVPLELLPKKGDKWLIEDSSQLLPEGFGGRVTSVEHGEGGYTVTTESLQPEEAFERALLKIAVGTQTQAKARKREKLLWGSEEPIELEPMGGLVGMTGSKDLINALDFASMSATPLGSIEYYIEPTLHARSFLSVDPLAGVHVDSYIGADAYIEYDAKVSGTLAARLDLPFPHKACRIRETTGPEGVPGYAKVLWKCGIFAEAAGSLDYDAMYKGTYRSMASAKYDKPGFGIGQWSGGIDYGFDSGNEEYDLKKYTLGVSFHGGFMLEAAFEFFNPLIWGTQGAGLRLEAGLGLSFKIPATSISDFLPATYYIDHTYDVLDIDDIVSFGPFVYGNPYVTLYGWQSTLPERKKFLQLKAGVVPKISDYEVRANFHGEHIPGEGTASYKLSRTLLAPVQVGLTVLDSNDDVYATYWRPDTYLNYFSTDKVESNFTFAPLKDEKTSYTIFPTIKMLGENPILCKEAVLEVEPAFFIIFDYDEIELPVEEGTLKLEGLDVDTNCPKVEVSTGVDWVTASWMPLNRCLVLHYKVLPKGIEGRECTLHIVGKNSKGEVLVVEDYTVRQGKIVIECIPQVIEAEAEGGTYTAKIVGTPLKELDVKPEESFIHPTLNENVITVVVDPNPDAEEREGFVIITGVSERGKTGEGRLKVHQKASEKFTVSPDTIEVPGYSSEFQNGVLKRQLTVVYPKSAKGLHLESSDKSWLTADSGGGIGSGTNTCTIDIKPNTSLKDSREAKINVELIKADSTKEVRTVTVKQSAMTIDVKLEPEEVKLKAKDSSDSEYSDKQTVQIKITPWDDIVASAIKSQDVKPAIGWIKVSRNGNTITVYGEANPVNEDRTNYVTYTLTPVSGDSIVRRLTVTQKGQEPETEFCDDYAPKPIHIPGDAQSQVSVTFNCPNVVRIIDIFTLNTWLSGIASGMNVSLTATEENQKGEVRLGQFQLTFLMKDGTTVKRIYNVYQDVPDDPSVAHVSPTSLDFPAKGGTKTVKVYLGRYTRSGYSISNEGQGWVGVVNYVDDGLHITVKPNTTGGKRSCIVNCHMTSSDNPTAADIETFPITITQEANELEPGQIVMQAITSCKFSATAMMKDRSTGGSAMKEYGETFTDVSFTQNGTNVHVQAKNNYKEEYDVYQNIIEFDITNFGDSFADCTIENLTFHHVYNDTYIDFTQPGLYGKSDDVVVQVSNLHLHDGSYKPGKSSSFAFGGNVSSGVAFTKLTEAKLYYSEDNPKQYFDYVENGSNSASLDLEFTANGTTTSRMLTWPMAFSRVQGTRRDPVVHQ